jgi:hypothetical protein
VEWRGILGENPISAALPSARGLTPPDRARAPAAGIRDQYRSPQICPVLPAYALNRTANVCFIHCIIAGRCKPSSGLIKNCQIIT